MLDNLKTDSSIEAERDTLGGSFVLDSDAYTFNIDLAYLDQSSGGAMSFNLHVSDKDGHKMENTLYITSGEAKGKKNYYEDKNGKKRYLPGFTQANNICLLITGKEISALESEIEKKVIKVWDSKEGKQINKELPVIMPLLNGQVTLGVQRQTVDKNVKDAAGNYVPSGETRDINEIDKVFRAADGLTVQEIVAEVTEPTFLNKWIEKNRGVTVNKAKGTAAPSAANAAATPAAAQASADAAKTTNSLFS